MKKNKIAKKLFLILSVFVVSLSPGYAFAIDRTFFSGNDILFYDPDACRTPGGDGGLPDVASTESEDKNAEIIFKFLISTNFSGLGDKPFNAIQAAGALGNFYQESHFNPGAIEDNGEGHGIAQWSFGRKTALFKLADEHNTKWNDLSLQLKMVENEINASYGKSLLSAGFGDVKSPKEASYIFQKIYEGAGIPAQAKRDAAAQKYYTKFKDLAPGDVDLTGSSACANEKTDFADDGFVIYNQCDPRWSGRPYGTSGKTICSSGCGPVATAMVITALTGEKVTPVETIDYANSQNLYITGQGSANNTPEVIAKKWGLTAKALPQSVSAINKALEDGALIVVAGRGPAPFTSAGHFIVIRGLVDGKWKVGDSNGQAGQDNSVKLWDPNGIVTYMNSPPYAITQ